MHAFHRQPRHRPRQRRRKFQILYNVAFSGTSFALPVAVLLFAFYAIGVEEKAGYIRILIGGLLTGSAVCGMHYVGQLGISNYRCSYHQANVVGIGYHRRLLQYDGVGYLLPVESDVDR